MRVMARFAMGATLAVGLSLILLLTLLLLLLARLFCSLLLRRQRPHHIQAVAVEDPSSSKPHGIPFYAHGVLRAAPTKFLLTVPKLEAAAAPPPPPASTTCNEADRFVRITNPIYDGAGDRDGTPFVTPRASPSCLEEEDDDGSPPLTLMRKLPPVLPKASSVVVAVCLMEGRRSLATSVSATETNRPSSPSSSNYSLCSSPSW